MPKHDLIDRAALQQTMRRSPYKLIGNAKYINLDAALVKLQKFPSVDAVPVVHGLWNPVCEWVEDANTKELMHRKLIGWRCSLCDEPNTSHDNYCPNCGAKMRGDADAE